METKTASEIMDIMEELGICVDSFTDDIYIRRIYEKFNKYGFGTTAPMIMNNNNK